MPVQETITGDRKLIGHKSTVKYRNGVKKQEFHSDIISVYTDKETLSPVIKIDNKFGKQDAYYRDVEPIEVTEDYFIYPITQDTLDKLGEIPEFKKLI
jgi:hypothetical protein